MHRLRHSIIPTVLRVGTPLLDYLRCNNTSASQVMVQVRRPISERTTNKLHSTTRMHRCRPNSRGVLNGEVDLTHTDTFWAYGAGPLVGDGETDVAFGVDVKNGTIMGYISTNSFCTYNNDTYSHARSTQHGVGGASVRLAGVVNTAPLVGSEQTPTNGVIVLHFPCGHAATAAVSSHLVWRQCW